MKPTKIEDQLNKLLDDPEGTPALACMMIISTLKCRYAGRRE